MMYKAFSGFVLFFALLWFIPSYGQNCTPLPTNDQVFLPIYQGLEYLNLDQPAPAPSTANAKMMEAIRTADATKLLDLVLNDEISQIDPNFLDDDQDFLMAAVKTQNLRFLELFIRFASKYHIELNPHAQNSQGESALDLVLSDKMGNRHFDRKAVFKMLKELPLFNSNRFEESLTKQPAMLVSGLVSDRELQKMLESQLKRQPSLYAWEEWADYAKNESRERKFEALLNLLKTIDKQSLLGP